MEIKNQPTFTSRRIVFLNSSEYIKRFVHNAQIKSCSVNDMVSDEKIRTEGIATCIAGNMMNQMIQSECGVFHYCRPNVTDIRGILSNTERLSQPETPAEILITGGQCTDLCRYFFQELVSALDKFKKHTTIIWGQKDWGYTNFVCDAKQGLTVVNHMHPRDKEIKSLADVNDIYEKVEIAKGDELLFGEQHLP